MTQIVVADIGGTHARFALACADGKNVELGTPLTLRTADFDGVEAAHTAFTQQLDEVPPPRLALALACPITPGPLALTNAHWVIDRDALRVRLALESLTVVNDFAAVAHAVAVTRPNLLHAISGDGHWPDEGVIAVIGPGTGLGVALIHLVETRAFVIATEGGHVDFAPVNAFEEQLLGTLRAQCGPISIESVVSGRGLAAMYSELKGTWYDDDRALWTAALEATDDVAVAALDAWCAALGSAAGNIALTTGARAVVIAGGLGARVADRLPTSRFTARFVDKRPHAELMKRLPVRALVDPQAGLRGAAAAFAKEYKP